jgi:hypothetical protein
MGARMANLRPGRLLRGHCIFQSSRFLGPNNFARVSFLPGSIQGFHFMGFKLFLRRAADQIAPPSSPRIAMIVKGCCRLGCHDATLSSPVRLGVMRLASGELLAREGKRWRISSGVERASMIAVSSIAKLRGVAKKRKLRVGYSPLAGHAAMGQLLMMLIIPPIVGVITYIVIRRVWERDENGSVEVVGRRDPSAAPAGRTSTDA